MSHYSEQAINAMSEALKKGMNTDDLAKSGITTATGLNYYDLMAPALLQIPVITPIREKLGRKKRSNPGVACHWKVITAMQGSGIDGMGYIPEGARSGVKGITTKDAFSTYVPFGEEGQTTDEAVLASQGLEDVLSMDRLLTLEKLMLKEEAALLYGNRSIKLGTPGAVTTGSVADANSTLNGSYYACVVALTAEGYAAASVSGGLIQAMTVTGQDSKTFTINGGSSNRSAITSTQAVSANNGLTLTTPVMQGAVAYAWYVGTSGAAGALYLQQITTINSALIESLVTANRQTSDQIANDCSYNDGTQSGANPVAAIDGLMTQAMLPANLAYYQALATGTPGTGTGFTANGIGVDEVDTMMLAMWNNFKIGVDVLYGSANTVRALSKKILNNNGSPLIRLVKDSNEDDGVQFTAGGMIRNYFSPIGNPYGGQKAAVVVHPNLPDGVLVGWSNNLPPWYRANETPAVAEILTRRDYYSIDWPRRTRATEYGVYADETLAVYAPWAMGVITNISVK